MALGLIQPLTEMCKGGRCIGLTLPPSCTNCLEIWEPQPPETLRAFYLIREDTTILETTAHNIRKLTHYLFVVFLTAPYFTKKVVSN